MPNEGRAMKQTQEQVIAYLDSVPAAFVTELVAAIGRPLNEIDAVLATLDRTCLVMVNHAAPDTLVTADLRIAARVTDGGIHNALAHAERHWQRWLKSFVQSHRCS
jgi:hypothetical protein